MMAALLQPKHVPMQIDYNNELCIEGLYSYLWVLGNISTLLMCSTKQSVVSCCTDIKQLYINHFRHALQSNDVQLCMVHKV